MAGSALVPCRFGTIHALIGSNATRDSGQSAVCVELMSTGWARQFGFFPPRHCLHGRATHFSVSGYEFLSNQPLFLSSFHWRSEGLSSAAPRPCGDRTRYLISCASTHTHAGRFCPPRRSMGARVFLWSPGCIANCSFSGPQEKRLRGGTGLRYQQLVAGYRSSSSMADEPDQARYFLSIRGHRRLQPGRIHSLHRCGSNRTPVQASFSGHPAFHAVVRSCDLHCNCSLCDRSHSGVEMGICADRAASGIAL